MGYVLLADDKVVACRSFDALAENPIWARGQGYATAKARRADGHVDRPLLPSERAQLVEDATRLALS